MSFEVGLSVEIVEVEENLIEIVDEVVIWWFS